MNSRKPVIFNFLFSIFLLLILPACVQTNKQNRLSSASSPYLQQHADNPVDWYEWGEEAISKAKKENKPLLISIGYASCHWCHVMEKESFMDTAVAGIMNEHFINIKVDREERPDIDNIYMNACQLLTGSGGWPLNAFALPDGKPFFAGTYYSKNSWISLLKQITLAYKEKNDMVIKQADALTKGISEEELSFVNADNAVLAIYKAGYQKLFDSVYQKTDKQFGGLKGSPKFPMPAVTEFLLQYYYLTGNRQALDIATNTLTRMALGGIYDHVGGGFARYSVDSIWRIPHFEKMLYDNGQLISLYAHAYQLTKNNFYKTILAETISFIERDLTSPDGGFYSSLNADTEDGEGEFYAWNFDEFSKINNTGSGKLIAEYFNVTPDGNWEKGKNILYGASTTHEFAGLKELSPDNFISVLNNAKKSLLTERNKRSKPATDTKILTAWNAIMLKSYADAYAATGNDDYLAEALSNGKFLEKNMMGKNGNLKRNFKDGKASIEGFLDDYAWLARAYIRLYQVTFDKHWLMMAKQITDYALANFYDSESGMFYYTAANSSNLVVRKMEIADNAIPSSGAIMAIVLYELGIYFGNSDYSDKSSRMFSKVAAKMKALPSYYTQWCWLAGLLSHGTHEVVIMGKEALKKNHELQKNYLPSCLYMGETDEENLPLLKDKLPDGKTLIYVCTNKVCKLPVEEVDRALKQIN